MANATSDDAQKREQLRAYQREWRRANPDKTREYRERHRDRDQRRREQNRDRKREYDRKYYERNGERIRALSRESSRKYRAKLSPDERAERHLKSRHGMHLAQWWAMYEEQSGKCYLCLRPLPDDRRSVDVDHQHGHCGGDRSCSLCRRGLACHDCNAAIGFFGDSPERLRIAADNLERAQAMAQARIASAARQESLF